MTIFLTGGSGFVGQNITPILIAHGHKVMAIARSERAAEKIRSVGATPVMDDLLRLSTNTREAMTSCDLVLHAAAHMDFTYDLAPYQALNIDATKELLRIAKSSGVRKFIYISAAPVVPGSPIIKLTEADAKPGLPSALYPRTKAQAERLVLAENCSQMKTISLRPPAIWGPDNHHYEDLLKNVRDGNWRWINGGRQVLSTIHVKNLANAILAAMASENGGGQAYFITDGDYRPLKETFSAIFKANGLDGGEKELPRAVANIMAHTFGGIWKILGLKSRPPIAPLMIRLMGTEFSVSDAKAREELGYKNAVSFEQGIKEME